MKNRSAVLLACVLAAMFAGCGGSENPSLATGSSTGTLTIKGSPTATSAFASSSDARATVLPKGASATTYAGTPTSVKIKMYKVYLSQNADCSNPVLVQDKTGTADYTEIYSQPTLFSNAVAPGTYNCMIIKQSDVMKFTPDNTAQASTGGVCQAGTENSFDILKTESPAEAWWDLDALGTTTGVGTYALASEQDVFLYFSTDNAAVVASNAQIHPGQVVTLADPISVVAGQETQGQFVFDFADQFSIMTYSAANYCWLEGIVVHFILNP